MSLMSRDGNVLSRFDALSAHLAAVFDVDDVLIDGEIIAAEETWQTTILRAFSRHAEPLLRRFRSPLANGTDLPTLPLIGRRQSPQGIVPKGSPMFLSRSLSGAGV